MLQRTNAAQLSRNLLLGTGTIDTKPELEIIADDALRPWGRRDRSDDELFYRGVALG